MFDQTVQPQFGGYPGMAPMGGFNYQQPTQMPKLYNVLSKDEIDLITKKAGQFSLSMTKEEQLRAVCNHRRSDGMGDALSFDETTGLATCSICGAQFRIIDKCNLDDVQDAVDNLLDYFQTAKYMFYDISRETAMEFYQIIGLIKKLPTFFDFASKNFNQHEINLGNTNPYNQSIMQRYNNIGGFGFAPQGFGYQQPMGYGAFQQPVQPQMNGMAPGFPQAAYQQPNPFGYAGAQPVGYQPQSNGFSYDPSQAAPQQVAPTVNSPAPTAAPQAPVAPAPQEATVTNTITL